MGFLTEREKEIIRLLKEGKTVRDIGKKFGVSDSSISKSITNIRTKGMYLKEDVEFLIAIGLVSIEEGELKFLTADRDPKALAKVVSINKR